MKTSTVAPAIARDVLAAAIGEYVWGSRVGQDAILRLDFGPPHLQVHEPSAKAAEFSGAARMALGRRVVLPVGRWHLFVESGLWCVAVSGFACDRFAAESNDPEMLGQIAKCISSLDGQKLTAADQVEPSGEWRFEFDLGGALSIRADTLAGADKKDAIWTLFLDDGTSMSYMSDRTFVLE